MKVLVFLKDYAVGDKIIDHLKLAFVAVKPALYYKAYQELLMTAKTSTEYFS